MENTKGKTSQRLIWVCVVILAATPLLAITGFPTEVKCPVCGETNILYVWASSGSYIYSWPSRFQLIFWPSTDPANLFLCKKCHFAAFSHDWHEFPAGKVAETRKLLATVAAPAIPESESEKGDTEEEKAWKRMVYLRVPMAVRLKIAERVYALWGMSEQEWCHFYRVKGYHLQREKQRAGADAARQKALELALKLSNEPEQSGARKETLIVIAAMHHYLGNDKQALAILREAAKLTYGVSTLKEEQNKNADAYLTKLARDYIDAIENGKPTDEPEETSAPAKEKGKP